MNYLTSGQPTNLPTVLHKTPDILDFCATKAINTQYFKTESCLYLSSDHSTIIITIYFQVLRKQKSPALFSNKTNWNLLRAILEELIYLKVPLKPESDIKEAIHNFTSTTQDGLASYTRL